MKYVVFDFETFSRADLQKCGAWKYAEDFSTGILCLALKVVTDGRPEPSRVLSENQIHAKDPGLMELAKDETVVFVAHNASFEQAMWKFHLVPLGYPELPPERWHDTMAVAGMKALPLGLDALVMALELPVKKDMDGHRLMLTMCKPDRIGGWSQHNDFNLDRLKTYCAGDTEAQYGVYVSTNGLGPLERHTWVLDQRVNQRGIKIDKDFVNASIDVLDQVRVPMTARFQELTGLRPTQREKVLNWVNDQGIALGDMKKETLNAILDPDDEFGIEDFSEPLPYHVHEVLTLRRSLASSSVSKLRRMLECASDYDGRVRYSTQYHGARTGRDAGRLIQIQNYPRGEIGTRQGLTADALAEAILTRNLGKIRELWGQDIFSAVISSLRSCIVPEPGKVLIVGDFAQVEAKNLLSMAGQHDKAEMLHSGQDAYAEMAALIFRKPINKVDNPLERQVGKNCLAADTMILTRNGLKPIVDVLDTDLLWDGNNWVTHQGLISQGSRETLNLSGLRMTPNHLVFIGDRWFPAGDLTPSILCRALDFAKAHGPCSAMPTRNKAFSPGLFVGVIARLIQNSWINIIFAVKNPQGAGNVLDQKPVAAIARTASTMKSVRIKPIAIDWSDASITCNGAAMTQKTLDIKTMVAEASNLIFQTYNLVWPIWSVLKDGITQTYKSTGLTTTRAIRRETFGLRRHPKTTKIAVQSPKFKINWTQRLKKLGCCEPVYDLVNAGPRNRFTVMTADGPLILHNCVMGNGYGLGPVGFRARFCPKEPIELAKLAVTTYRKEFAPLIPRFWYGLWEASVAAVWCEHAKTYIYEGIEFRKEGDFLTMRLPSGRKLHYHRPRKGTSYDFNGNERPSWTFMSYQGKKFRRHLAWHGMLTADCIQGLSRDLIMGAMKRAEAAGLNTIFKVHDELVFEEVDRPDLVPMVKQIMEDIEPWAIERRLKIKTEVSKMLRYTK